MRKFLICLLLAAAATTPALADPGDHSDPETTRAARQQMRAERQERAASERPQLNGRSNFSGMSNRSAQRQQSFVQQQSIPQNVQQNVPANVQPGDAAQVETVRAERQRVRLQQRQQVLEGRRGQVADESLRQSSRPVPGVLRTRDRSPMVSDVPRPGTQPPLHTQNHHRDQVSWNRDWRHDGRYDWHSWRDRHRSSFHLGFYYDPFGWGYQPYSIGWRLWPSYYGSNYWISDPWQYRLPYAPPGTRWVRYYNDALLVDTFTGEVVDVIRGFFW